MIPRRVKKWNPQSLEDVPRDLPGHQVLPDIAGDDDCIGMQRIDHADGLAQVRGRVRRVLLGYVRVAELNNRHLGVTDGNRNYKRQEPDQSKGRCMEKRRRITLVSSNLHLRLTFLDLYETVAAIEVGRSCCPMFLGGKTNDEYQSRNSDFWRRLFLVY